MAAPGTGPAETQSFGGLRGQRVVVKHDAPWTLGGMAVLPLLGQSPF